MGRSAICAATWTTWRTRTSGDYESITVPVDRDTVLLLSTDGLVEQRGRDIDASLRTLTDLRLPTDGALEHLLDVLLTRPANGVHEDDVALLAARRSR
ncbi:SpoIIE family protein phosphatase [Streptomyces sp. NPDC002928]|uniref:SpoIIE family protein phosphatase n=1 Tax=Streptomyces sp. NPDC002928 TaxID=3154440 RepID=UPI0033A87C16